ncbi:AAA ATPase [Thecaphora frezii]
MPTTRALSARLQAGLHSHGKAVEAGDNDIDAIKARQTRSPSKQQPQQPSLPSVRIPASISTQGLDRVLRKPRLTRNASTPASTMTADDSPKRTAFGSRSSTNTTSTKSNGLPAGPRRSTSSVSSGRSVLGSECLSDSESSDDENDGENRARLGGCSQQSQASDEPDDANKENVAPWRCASVDVLNLEARDAQEEAVARRTRGRRSSLMERHATSLPSSSDGTPRASTAASHSSDTVGAVRTTASNISAATFVPPRTPSKRMSRSRPDLAAHSSPSTSNLLLTPQRTPNNGSRKRSRQAIDEDEVRIPGTPFSKMRLSPRKPTATASIAGMDGEDAESYFGSQASSGTSGSSLFENLSQADSSSSAATSREPSPAVQQALIKGTDQAPLDHYSNVYSHARALLRYAAGVDPAETEAGLTICGHRQTDSHVKVVGRARERVAIEQFLDQRLGLFPHAKAHAAELNVELDGDAESGCLYVCGLPGTGKTALVRSTLHQLLATKSERARPPRVAFVNCMTLTHPRFVFGKVLSALGSDAAEGQSDVEAERALSTLIQEGGQRILIVLDEMDHLLHSRAHQNVLYRLFSWATPHISSAKRRSAPSCSLIGIANSLDLTERFVPLLASKGASPALLHFRPFEAAEIVGIVRDRLTGLYQRYENDASAQPAGAMDDDGGAKDQNKLDLPLFTAPAVELLAKKIATATGDLRKALDAARLAVELVEAEQRKAALVAVEEAATAAAATTPPLQAGAQDSAAATQCSSGDNDQAAADTANTASNATISDATPPGAAAADLASARAKVLSHLTPATAAKAGPAHILKVLATVLGSPNLSKIRNLGLQPKLVLLALLVADARGREGLAVLGSASGTQAPRVSKGSLASGLRLSEVESTYASLLKNDGTFSALESSELLGVFELLEVQGIVQLCSEVERRAPASRTLGVAVVSAGVSPSGKRAAKKQLLAANRSVKLVVAVEDVVKGITTVATSIRGGNTGGGGGAGGGAGAGKAVAETLDRIWKKEQQRIVQSRGWQEIEREKERVRREELGGGRGEVAVGL